MKNFGKIRTSVWIRSNLILLLNERGMTLSSFIGRALPIFLDLPEDPREKLIQEKIEETVLRLRSTYMKEIREVMKEHDALSSTKDTEKILEADLYKFGEYLQKSPSYTNFKRCLERKMIDDDILDRIVVDVNKLSGVNYDPLDLWNKAVTWHNKYGRVVS